METLQAVLLLAIIVCAPWSGVIIDWMLRKFK